MKILIISPDFPPVKSGTSDWIFKLFQELLKRDCNVELVTTNNREINLYLKKFIYKNKVHPLIDWNIFGIIRLIKLVKQMNPDIVHIEYPGGFGRLMRYEYRILMSLFPLLIRVNGYTGKIFLRLHEFNEVMIITRIFASILMFCVNKIAIASKSDYEIIVKLFPFIEDKLEFIPSGSNIPYVIYSSDELTTTKEKLQSYPNQPIIGYFGFIRDGKGIEALLNACDILVRKSIDFKLLVIADLNVSDNSYHKRIYEIISQYRLGNYIHFTGYLDPSITSLYLQCMDIIVLPYDKGLSLRRGSLMAAIEHNLPIISTKIKSPDLSYFLNNELILVKPKDPHVLANAIEKLMNSEKDRNNLKKSISKISNIFSWESIANMLINSYKDILDLN